MLVRLVAVLLHGGPERFEDVVGLFLDDLSMVDDLLPALDPSLGEGDGFQEFLLHRFVLLLVVGEVLVDVVIDVVSLERLLVERGGDSVDDVFVGCFCGVEGRDGTVLRSVAGEDVDLAFLLLVQFVHVVGGYDAAGVESLQFTGDVVLVVVRCVVLLLAELLVQEADVFAGHPLVVDEERVEVAQQAILLPLDILLGFHDFEGEGSGERVILPWLFYCVVVFELPEVRVSLEYDQTSDEEHGRDGDVAHI